jgi:hypothetical protein
VRSLPLVLAAACGLAACSPADPVPDAGPHGCPYAPLGDPSQPAVVELLGLGPDGRTLVTLHDGDPVTLAFPPQGGRVIFAGVRATNLDPCGVQLAGVVRDEASMQVRLDSRTVNLKPTGDGWAESDPADISSFANIPVCPNEWSKTNLFGTTYGLEMTLTERSGRTESLTMKVVPACDEPAHEAECLCICQGGYVLGQSCAPVDAGTGDAGGGDGGP